jgi:hypothetical protein
MAGAALDNPILNGPYDAPSQHFELSASGPTGTILEGRRPSESFIPVPSPRKGKHKAQQSILDAMIRLERRHGRTTFDLVDIVQEVLAEDPARSESSVRTHIVSVMCREAPVNHANHTDDLERIDRGRYRRIRGSVSAAKSVPVRSSATIETAVPDVNAWPWEGAVQTVLTEELLRRGWEVESVADTSSGQQGVDVVARHGVERLLVEVKGYPLPVYQRGTRTGTPKPTTPATQARHWFAGALLSGALNRDAHLEATVVIAVPDFPTYRNLAHRTRHSRTEAGIEVWLVSQGGSIETG